MTTPHWFMLIGALLLFIGLTSSILQRSTLTAAIIYLLVGLVVGPTGFNLFHFNPLQESALLELLTEVAVLVSLFAAGIKMPAPMIWKRWSAPVLLATVGMTLTVLMVAAFGWFALGLPLGACILLGAILAPTDSVLAGDIQGSTADDHKRLRFTLACEAGMNDGSAFPFVMLGLGLLGLHDLGEFSLQWLAVDVVWATVAGIAIGVVSGILLGQLGRKLRRDPYRHVLMDDFIALGLIALVYGVCVLAHAWGFLGVFFAAVALRQTEHRLELGRHVFRPEFIVEGTVQNGGTGNATMLNDPFAADSTAEEEPPPTVSEGSLMFNEQLERLSVALLILLLGGTLFLDSWTWDAVLLSLFLFFLARPLSVLVCQLGTRIPWRMRLLTGWFGVRGIGSLYYLMYAIQHGLPETLALQLIQLTLIVVTLSILLHGISVKPLFAQGWKRPLKSQTTSL